MTEPKAVGETDYTQAIRGLASPDSWCESARSLAAAGERRALIPLLEAYESPIEGGKRCLLEAMEQLDAGNVQHRHLQQARTLAPAKRFGRRPTWQ